MRWPTFMQGLEKSCLLAVICASLLAMGCTQPKVSNDDPIDGVPDDFSVDLTILVNPVGVRAHERTSRLVVLADGALFFDAESGRGPNTKPGWVRGLDREEMARLWDAAIRNGLTNTALADPVADVRRARMPAKGSSVWLLTFTANGDRWNYLRSYGPEAKPDTALRSFARDALALAWAPDTLEAHAVVEPSRWDFGPDPWGEWNASLEQRNEVEQPNVAP